MQLIAWLIFSTCDAKLLFTWSQIIEGSNLSVRAVVSPDDECPLLDVESVVVAMSVRDACSGGI
ncbi:hypothetical protein [Candidatus Anaplasma sp. TIGMIC]|uniref:hypothetical protein n=1 Tax=Candidatus Anaplasma sp. TIGMIC TaxID=3020713 RepID=UPI00232AA2B4|nr:hypothetical protein [Candidatus Anaplasma sp. TIGMIC]MDB1135433.1 hypothetical protein [Candidatus Anaplasma sp. TIGMIC]